MITNLPPLFNSLVAGTRDIFVPGGISFPRTLPTLQARWARIPTTFRFPMVKVRNLDLPAYWFRLGVP
jgi:hypothetical protein